jgi:CCR4-NOT transcription complex subunit 6
MNIQGYQGLTPAQQLLQQQQQQQQQSQQKQQQQQQQQKPQQGTPLQFNDLFQSMNSSIGQGNAADALSHSQLLQQTLYQGQYNRAQTPQQRNIQPQLQQGPQGPQGLPQSQQQPVHRAISLDQSIAVLGHWQDQMQLAELSRKSNVPHFYARHAAVVSRRAKPQFGEQKSLVDLTRQLLDSDHNQHSPELQTQTSTNSVLLHNKKVSHDNENDDDFDDFAIPRITSKKFPDQLWGGLDLSGQAIANLSPKLFQYEFLTKLYLNGNNLSQVPKEIKNLKYLKVLDLSNNRLTSVPPELGLLTALKYLYLFDNNLTTLPFEFGNLFALHFLGLEGNPDFNLEYIKILAQKGTRSLIIHLRDNVPKTLPPPKRQWIELSEDGEIADPDDEQEMQDEKGSFTVLDYNVLCQHYASARMYSYTPSWALSWDYRKDVLKKQILECDADVICLQEVETQLFEDYWLDLMAERGYRGVFHAKYRARRMNEKEAKKVDGCATFYKASKFSLAEKKSLEYTQIVLNAARYKKTDDVFNRLQSRDNIGLITILTNLETQQDILVANTHLHWDPALNDVKTVQVGVLLEEIELIAKKNLKTTEDSVMKTLPVLVCGDFNSQPHSAVYQLFSTGFVKDHEDVKGRDYGKFTEKGFSHGFHFKSAYSNIGEMSFTNFTPSFTDVLDYIWYTPSTLSVRGLLGEMDSEYLSHYVGFPNAHAPSDHIPLLTKFQLKQKREIAPIRREFKPEFRSSRKT